MRRCIDCAFFRPYNGESLEHLDPDDVGQCTWRPLGPLPLTWRFAVREVTGATAGDTGCRAFAPRYKD